MLSRLRQLGNLRRRLVDERGQSLVLALIVLLVLTISAGAVAQLMTSNANTSNRERQGVQAFGGGEAGLDTAANWVVLHDAGNVLPVNPTTPAWSQTDTIAGNTVSWKTFKVSTGQWKINSTTVSPNGKVTKVLEEQLQATPGGQPSTFWGYGFVMGGQSNPGGYTPNQICDNHLGPDKPTVFGGSGTVNVPVWTAGDICTSGGDSPIRNPTTGSPITVHVGGFVYGYNGPRYIVGAPGNKVANFEAIGGCYDTHTNSGQLPLACDQGGDATSGGGNSGIYSNAFTATTQVVTPPSLSAAEELALYNSASPGPMHPCTPALSSGTWPTNLFDSTGSTVPDTSLGTRNLMTGLGTNAFVCRTSSGSIAWKPAQYNGDPSCLHIVGTVFLDGSYTLDSAKYIRIDTDGSNFCGDGTAGNPVTYPDGASNGSIYIDGTFAMSSDASICAPVDFGSGKCTIPATGATIPNVFWSFFNRAQTIPAVSMSNNTSFEGSAFINGKFDLTGGCSCSAIGGSIFAQYASITGGTSFSVSTAVPQGSIGSAGTSSWQVAPRTWRQCPISGCT